MDAIRAIQVACTNLAMCYGLTYCEMTGLFMCHSTATRDRQAWDSYNRLKELEAELTTAEMQ